MCNFSNKILVPVVVLILLTQMVAQPQGKFSPRIRNGYQCDTSIAPYFVRIHAFGEGVGACGGSLITYSWVLTAAHCLSPEGGKVFSAHDMSPELKQTRKIKEMHPHPEFNKEAKKKNGYYLRGDIGLILVDEPFHETKATRVATLPAPGFTKHCNQVMAPGIGQTYTNESKTEIFPVEQRPLMCVSVNIIDINTCRKNFSPVKEFDTGRNLCTYGQGIRGPCAGDSGGPLICDNVVIGTVSTGGDCNKRDVPTAYMKVESYLDFIDHLVRFTGISIKHGRSNDTSAGGKKPFDNSPGNSSNKHVHSNDTSAAGKKTSDKSSANKAQGRVLGWKLVLYTLLYLIVLYH